MRTSADKMFKGKRKERIVVDCAGAVKGGAARFLRELRAYLEDTRPSNVELIGLGKQLTPQWLVQREFIAASATYRISLNNAGFVNPKGKNVTLLRNILQFATQDDMDSLGFTPPKRLRAQTPVVRVLAGASDTLVVPSTKMAEKVSSVAPRLADKIAVRFHPVSQPTWAGTTPKNPHDVLLPIVPAPYKNLDQHISEFLNASGSLFDKSIRLIVPAQANSLSGLDKHPRVDFIGPQNSEELEQYWRDCAAIFFPVEFEAFGYPLAEARVYGRNVIAQDTNQNREIAGEALKPYRKGDINSLQAALETAISEDTISDPAPFNPMSYFDWLLQG